MILYYCNFSEENTQGRHGLHLPLTSSSNNNPLEDNENNLALPLQEWQLLECHFGLPLFDANLNKQVSQRIISHKLLTQENIVEFSQSSDELVLKLRKFIVSHRARVSSVDLQKRSKNSGDSSSSSLPLPTVPLLFNNGSLGPWDGS